MKPLRMMSILVAMLGFGTSMAQQLLPYQDADNTPEMRAMDLVERLTFEQKLSLLQPESPAIEDLRIPAYRRPYLTADGIALPGLATAFPQTIGMAASFDAELVQQVMAAISFEQRIRYVQSRRSGKAAGDCALTVMAPSLNVEVDPRWGQGHESFGEDPYLTSQMGLSALVGLQGSLDETVYEPAGRGHWNDYDRLHACLPYYGIEGLASAEPHSLGDDAISARDLAETYLYAFENLVRKGDVHEVMTSYSLAEGKPCCGMDRLLLEILRKEWGYTGLVVNKSGIVGQEVFEPEAEVVPDVVEMLPADTLAASEVVDVLPADTLAVSIVAEALPSDTVATSDSVGVVPAVAAIASDSVGVAPAVAAVASDSVRVAPAIVAEASDSVGVAPAVVAIASDSVEVAPAVAAEASDVAEVVPQAIDSAAIDLAALRVLTDRFRLGQMDPDANVSWNHIPNYLLAGTQHERLALEMAHESIVLLKNDGQLLPLSDKTVALVGVNAADSLVLLGNTDCKPRHTVTVLQALTDKLGAQRVIYRPGPVGEEPFDYEPLLAETAEADLFVVVANATSEGYELPQQERETLRRLHQTGKPVVLVCMSGGAVGLEPELETCNAILLSWYGGQQGGQAVADVLCGDYNPSARLPLTIYRHADQLPDAGAYSMEGRTYRYFKGEPLFAFGQGLSYSTFRYGQARFRKRTRDFGEFDDAIAYSVVVDITNTSDRDGAEVVQVYLKRDDDKAGPQRTLRGFKRVEINAGETVSVEVPITDIRTYDPHTGNLGVVHGTYTIYWGRSSRLRDLQSMKVEL